MIYSSLMDLVPEQRLYEKTNEYIKKELVG